MPRPRERDIGLDVGVLPDLVHHRGEEEQGGGATQAVGNQGDWFIASQCIGVLNQGLQVVIVTLFDELICSEQRGGGREDIATLGSIYGQLFICVCIWHCGTIHCTESYPVA